MEVIILLKDVTKSLYFERTDDRGIDFSVCLCRVGIAIFSYLYLNN